MGSMFHCILDEYFTNMHKSIWLLISRFLRNFSGHSSVVNALAVNDDGVFVSCGDDGTMRFWDYKTGYCFQKTETVVQPGG
jgi:WD40 repeat protein